MNLQTGNVAARLAHAILGFIIKTGSTRSSFRSTPTPFPHCYCLSTGEARNLTLEYYNSTLVYSVRMFFLNGVHIVLLSCLNHVVQNRLQICFA